jgi:hypothetical protein
MTLHASYIWVVVFIFLFFMVLVVPYLRSRDVDSYWKGFGEGKESGWKAAEAYYKRLYTSDLL